MKWILQKTKIDEKVFDKVESKLDIKFPVDFKNIVLENNGASPEKMYFDTQETKERVAEYLLSFSQNDEDNILDIFNHIKNRFSKKLVPIIKDPFGNYICFDFSNEDKKDLYFWNHENDTLEYISKTFTQFIEKLY
jgi:cell wall assembly regulator SMI1